MGDLLSCGQQVCCAHTSMRLACPPYRAGDGVPNQPSMGQARS